MALVNEHFLKLPGSYLFSDIAKKINTFRITHPKQDVIRLGIGDVTRPLPQACIQAMHKAVDEMADAKTFHGYGPEQGYDFLIDACSSVRLRTIACTSFCPISSNAYFLRCPDIISNPSVVGRTRTGTSCPFSFILSTRCIISSSVLT